MDVRKEPSYDALEPAHRKQITVEVEKARRGAELYSRAWKVIIPAALDESTRQVIEQRRRDGLRIPELVNPRGELRDSSGRWAPDSLRPHTTGDYAYVLARPLLLLGITAVVLAAILAHASSAALSMAESAVIGATVLGLLEIVYSRRVLVRMGNENAELQKNSDTRCRASDADQYTFTYDQKSKMIACAKPIDQSWPEIGLAAVAERLATRITKSAAWKDAALDPHRLMFSPRDEADEVRQHALRIAAARSQVGDDPAGDSDVHRQAHTFLAREREVLDALVQPLRERVVALWAYAEKVDELSSQIAALRSIEKAMAVSPELEALARQTGADELATDQLRRLTADAETISAQITAATEFLTNTLRVY